MRAIWSAFVQRWEPALRYRCSVFRGKDGRLFFHQIYELYRWLWPRTR